MDSRVELLTKREVELLHHVFLGRRTAEIAQIEGIANQTVLNRLQEARGKLGGVDRRTAAVIVATAKGWVPGIKPTLVKNTLSAVATGAPVGRVSHRGWQADQGHNDLRQEDTVFVQTLVPEEPAPSPSRRNQHDLLSRVSMLLLRTALLVATMVALLWVYGRV
jgi:DNA-binding CsgD family transcriptional regulator